MTASHGAITRRRAAKLALAVVSPALAAVLLSFGSSLVLDPHAAEDLARMGVGTGLRLLLGASHAAGGMALLVPTFAGPASMFVALIAGGAAAYLVATGQGVMAGGPALTAVLLISFRVSKGLRERADELSWQRMLQRYGERADAGSSRHP